MEQKNNPTNTDNLEQDSKSENSPQKVGWRQYISNRWQYFLETLQSTFDKHLGFFSDSKIRWVIIIIILSCALIFSYNSYNDQLSLYLPIWGLIFAFSLIIFLFLDSIIYTNSILEASLGKRVNFIRRLYRRIQISINEAIEDVKNGGNTGEFYVGEYFAEFKNLRPLPRLIPKMLFRSICNFLLSVMCFGFISMNLVRLHINWCGVDTIIPYKHTCFEGKDFLEASLHLFYYHLVLFQSLGDGNHSPETMDAQIIASLEVLIAFGYTILILGGVLSVATFVQSELTPEKLKADLEKLLKETTQQNIQKGQAPITKDVEK